MKNIYPGFAIILALIVGFSYLACSKSDSPLGIYAPDGADVPSPTFTPLTGEIQVYVVDQSYNSIAGVTVHITDPDGVVSVSVTAPYAAFSPHPLKPGSWTAEIPSQGQFFESLQNFSVTSSGQSSVTFLYGNTSLSPSPVTLIFSYPSGNNGTPLGGYNMPITFTYFQPGNLSTPVSLYMLTTLPAGYTYSPQTVVLGAGIDSSVVTVTQWSCLPQSNVIPMTFGAFDFLNNPKFNPVIYEKKSYAIPVTLSVATTTQQRVVGEFMDLEFTLRTDNDCGISWNLTVNDPSCDLISNDIWQLANGQTVSTGLQKCAWQDTVNVKISSIYGTASGTFSNNFNGAVINADF